MRTLFLIVLLICITSCSNDAKQTFELPDNARGLIAGDSIKTWKLARRFNNGTRMNMGDCFLAYQQSFLSNGEFFTGSGGRKDCGEPMLGKWSLAKDTEGGSYIKLVSEQIPEMLNIDEEFKLFKINHLSDTLLVLQFNHAQTTKKQTTLVDYFVPIGVKVDDRAFHW